LKENATNRKERALVTLVLLSNLIIGFNGKVFIKWLVYLKKKKKKKKKKKYIIFSYWDWLTSKMKKVGSLFILKRRCVWSNHHRGTTC